MQTVKGVLNNDGYDGCKHKIVAVVAPLPFSKWELF
jgi:hypothetical protein